MSPHEPPSLLIFRIGSIGDTVVSLPCFHAIARAFPRHRKILLTSTIDVAHASSVESVLEGSGLIDATVYFPMGRGKLAQSFELARKLRQLNVATLVYLAPRPSGLPVIRDLVFFRAAGIKDIIGAPLTRALRACRVDPATGELEYEAERLARSLAGSIPVDLSRPNWDLRLSTQERAVAAERLAGLSRSGPLVALAPGAKIPTKDWGEEHWAGLIGLLQVRIPEMSLVFVGAPGERPLTQRLARIWNGAKRDLSGELTPRQAAAVLGRCQVLVCHDSGPMHLAASQGTQCVALFGNYNRPREWFPFGSGHRVIHDANGVRQIGIERVAEAVEMAVRELYELSDAAPVCCTP
jgi:ADP-heptose:LPS heptosyltransferase